MKKLLIFIILLVGCAAEYDPLIRHMDHVEIAKQCSWEESMWEANGVWVGSRTCLDHHISTRLSYTDCVGLLEGWNDCSSRRSQRRAWIEALVGPEPCEAAFNIEDFYGEQDYCLGDE